MTPRAGASRRTQRLLVHIVSSLVTLARSPFQSRVVEDSDIAAAVIDQSSLVQRSRSLGNAHPPHTEHVGQELMRQMESVAVSTVATHEQPAGQTRLNEVIAGTCSRLRKLPRQHIDIAIQARMKLVVLPAVPPEGEGAHAQCGPGALDYCVLGRHAHAENQGRTQHAFVANDSNLESRAVIERGYQ